MHELGGAVEDLDAITPCRSCWRYKSYRVGALAPTASPQVGVIDCDVRNLFDEGAGDNYGSWSLSDARNWRDAGDGRLLNWIWDRYRRASNCQIEGRITTADVVVRKILNWVECVTRECKNLNAWINPNPSLDVGFYLSNRFTRLDIEHDRPVGRCMDENLSGVCRTDAYK